MKRYWGFRISTGAEERKYLADELDKGNLRIIEKWVITTKASKEENEVLENTAKNCEIPVKILFAEDLKKLLYKAAMAK